MNWKFCACERVQWHKKFLCETATMELVTRPILKHVLVINVTQMLITLIGNVKSQDVSNNLRLVYNEWYVCMTDRQGQSYKENKLEMLTFCRFFQRCILKFIIIIRWVTGSSFRTRHGVTLPVIRLALRGSSSVVREGSCIFSGPGVTFATSFRDADDNCDDDDDQKNSKCNRKTDNQPIIGRIARRWCHSDVRMLWLVWCHVTYTRTVIMSVANPYLQQTKFDL